MRESRARREIEDWRRRGEVCGSVDESGKGTMFSGINAGDYGDDLVGRKRMSALILAIDAKGKRDARRKDEAKCESDVRQNE